jgi:hypothetical protein
MSESEDQHVTTGQITEFLTIDRAGSGFRRQFQAFIRGLSQGGVEGSKTSAKVARRLETLRRAQAQRYWDFQVEFGSAWISGYESFEDYLATIPEVSTWLQEDDRDFPLLVLVETRYSLRRLCLFAGVQFDGDDDTFVACDDRHREFTKPTWIRVQEGRRNRGQAACNCRKSFGQNELGLTALQGVCLYVQYPQAVSEVTQPGAHAMSLSGSIYRDNRDDVARLSLWNGKPRLHWDFGGLAGPLCGSASRRA